MAVVEYSYLRWIDSSILWEDINIASTRTRDLLEKLLNGTVLHNELDIEYEIFRWIEQEITPRVVLWVEEYLEYLKIKWENIVLVTNSRIRSWIQDIVNNIPVELRVFFPVWNIVSRVHENDPKKPHPFLYLCALNRFWIKQDDVQVYEDTLRWIIAANKAWISSIIGIKSSPYHNEWELLWIWAKNVISNYKDLIY